MDEQDIETWDLEAWNRMFGGPCEIQIETAEDDRR